MDAESCGLKDEDIASVVNVPGIRSLYDNNEFGPVAWSQFGALKDLEALMAFSHLTDQSLRCLPNLTRLESLILRTTITFSASPDQPRPFSGAALEALKSMKELRELELESVGLDDDALSKIGKVPGLISLSLNGRFTDDGLADLRDLITLRRLSLKGNFTDAGLAHLSQLRNLEALSLHSPRVTGVGLNDLSRLPRLKLFKMSGLKPGLTLNGLENWQSLRALNLVDLGLTDKIILTLPRLDKLKSLSLQLARISDHGLTVLQRFPHLEELDLLLTPVTDRGMESVSQCRNLRKLCLGESVAVPLITEAGLIKLTQLPQLESLDLRYIGLSNVDLSKLRIPSLKALNLESLGRVERTGKLSTLRELLPNLADSFETRVTIEAGLCDESRFRSYDIFSNRMEVD